MCTGSFYEEAVLCSQSIPPRQTCARPPSLWTLNSGHFELWTLVGRPAAAEEEGRKGRRGLTKAVEGERGDSLGFHSSRERGGFFGLSLFVVFLQANTHTRARTHTHTHTHTHTSYSSSWSCSGTFTHVWPPYPQKLLQDKSAIDRSQVSTTRNCSLSISSTCQLTTLVSLPHPHPLLPPSPSHSRGA